MRKLLSISVAALLALAVTACEETPTTPEATQRTAADVDPPMASLSSTSGLVNSNASFPNWHQGFNHGMEGWYGKDMTDPGELGWCGTIDMKRRSQGPAGMTPSAGRGFAVVEQDVCNAHWDGVFSAPGAKLVGVPWAPGPGFAALGNPFPSGGYTVELDIYLDPDSYEAVGPESGTWVFECLAPPCWKGAVLGYSVSFMTLDDGSFHYVWVPVNEGEGSGSLTVNGRSISEPGWYTFRFLFGSDQGDLDVTFELADRDGQTLLSESVDETLYAGDDPGSYAVSNVGTGYAWFTSVSEGLDLPIDEYRIRKRD